MPYVLPYIIQAAAYVGAFIESYGAYILAAAAVAQAATTANQAAQAKNRQRQLAGQRDVTVRSTIAPNSTIYGRCRASGPVVYTNTVHDNPSTNNTNLWVVIPVCGHLCAAFEDVYIDDLYTTAAQINWATDGAVTAGPLYAGTAHAHFYRELGAASQTAIAALVADFPSDITSNFKADGTAYLAASFSLSKTSREIYSSAPQQIRWVVKGRLIYDPRRDPTHASYSGAGAQALATVSTWEWSENPALIMADYLVHNRFGMLVDADEIVWSEVATEADICDALVAIPGATTQKRYTCNGQLFTTATHRQNLDAIASSMAGRYFWTGGRWRIRAGAYVAPTVSIGPDAIVGNVQVRTAPQRTERYNTVRGSFVDPSQLWEEIEFPAMTDAAYIARDGGDELVRSLYLPMSNSAYQGQRIAFKELLKSNAPRVVVLTLNLLGLKIAVGDTVDVTVPDLGWSAEVFRCINWTLNESGIEVVLRDESSALWADPVAADYLTPTAAPTVTTPDVHSDGTRTLAGLPQSFVWVSADGGTTWNPSDDTQQLVLRFNRDGAEVATVAIDADLNTTTGNIDLTDGTHTGENVTVTLTNDNTYLATATAVHDDSMATTFATFQAVKEFSGVAGGGGGPGK